MQWEPRIMHSEWRDRLNVSFKLKNEVIKFGVDALKWNYYTYGTYVGNK